MATPAVSIASDRPYWFEGDEGVQTATFTVTRSGDLSAVSRVRFDIDEEGPERLLQSQGLVEFAPGETVKKISVSWQADTAYDAGGSWARYQNDGFLFARLSQAENAQVVFNPNNQTLILEDDGVVPILQRPNLQDGSLAADQALTGDPQPTAVYFDLAGPTGQDTIQGFGANDVLALTQQLADPDGDGQIPVGAGGTLALPGPGGGQLVFQGGLDQGLRYLGRNQEGLFLYADAAVRPPGAREGLISADGRLYGGGQPVVFMDTALDVRLVTNPLYENDPPGITLDPDTVLVTTVQLQSTERSGLFSLTGVTGELGPLAIWVGPRTQAAELQYFGSTTHEGVDYYVYGLPGSQHVPEEVFDPVILGSAESDLLSGTAAADRIWGLDGADTLEGKAGADTLVGGRDDDVYYVDSAADRTVELTSEIVNEGQDTVHSYVDWTLAENTELLYLRGSTDLRGTGNALDNTLVGNSGRNILLGLDGDDVLDSRAKPDRLDGGAGNDTLIGGLNSDVFVFGLGYGHDVIDDFDGDRIEVSGYAGWSRIEQSGSDVLITFSSADSLTLKNFTLAQVDPSRFTWVNPGPQPPPGAIVGGSGADALNGTSSADEIWGFVGEDTLDGKAGADTLVGGLDDDVYHVDSTGDRTRELADQGQDTVHSYVDWTLAENTEALHLRGSAYIDGTGNALGNTLVGNSGRNVLIGLGGDDVLDSRASPDRLDGGAGNDTLIGGLNSDVFVFGIGYGEDVIEDFDGDRVEVSGFAGWDRLLQSGSDVLIDFPGFDSLRLKNFTVAEVDPSRFTWVDPANEPPPGAITGTTGADALNGTSAANEIWGFAGDDTLDGKAGADTMVGGLGDDVYYVDTATTASGIGDRVTELADQGEDTVHSYIDYFLIRHVETLYLRGSASLQGIGNDLDNTIVGNSGQNRLRGSAGDDVLDARAEDDRLNGEAGNDTLIGGLGSDLFEFSRDYHHDVIQDFEDGEQIDVFRYTAWTKIEQSGSNVVVTFSAADTLTIIGASVSSVTDAIDFV